MQVKKIILLGLPAAQSQLLTPSLDTSLDTS